MGCLFLGDRDRRADDSSESAVAGNGILYWIRQDYRLHDNPALFAAAAAAKRSGGKLTIMYVCSPDEDGDDPETGACSPPKAILSQRRSLACRWPLFDWPLICALHKLGRMGEGQR